MTRTSAGPSATGITTRPNTSAIARTGLSFTVATRPGIHASSKRSQPAAGTPTTDSRRGPSRRSLAIRAPASGASDSRPGSGAPSPGRMTRRHAPGDEPAGGAIAATQASTWSGDGAGVVGCSA